MKIDFKHCVQLVLCSVVMALSSVSVAKAQVSEPEAGKARKPTDEWVKLTPEEYIYRWRETAIENMELYGIPASITMGQAILESGFGNGYLARVANNHFCIKCKKSWTGPTITHNDDRPDDCFRVYESAEASFADHAEFLNEGQRYQFLFAYDTDDYKSWAKGLKKAGYATAPDYDARLISVIERYHLYLLDGKNPIKRYDDYVAEELGHDPEALAESAATAKRGKDGKRESSKHRDDSSAKGDSNASDDIPKAYCEEGIDPNNFRVTINSHHGYNVYLTNGAHYIIAKGGDSFASLGELFKVSPHTLRKFNDLKGDAEPKEGDVVYIERKASRWGGAEATHTIKQGETLRSISQEYGVRLNQLTKLNRLRADAKLTPGTTLKLR